MTISFSDYEMQWIDKKPFNWSIKEGCPKEVRKSLERKLDILYNKKQTAGGDSYGKDRSTDG